MTEGEGGKIPKENNETSLDLAKHIPRLVVPPDPRDIHNSLLETVIHLGKDQPVLLTP